MIVIHRPRQAKDGAYYWSCLGFDVNWMLVGDLLGEGVYGAKPLGYSWYDQMWAWNDPGGLHWGAAVPSGAYLGGDVAKTVFGLFPSLRSLFPRFVAGTGYIPECVVASVQSDTPGEAQNGFNEPIVAMDIRPGQPFNSAYHSLTGNGRDIQLWWPAAIAGVVTCPGYVLLRIPPSQLNYEAYRIIGIHLEDGDRLEWRIRFVIPKIGHALLVWEGYPNGFELPQYENQTTNKWVFHIEGLRNGSWGTLWPFEMRFNLKGNGTITSTCAGLGLMNRTRTIHPCGAITDLWDPTSVVPCLGPLLPNIQVPIVGQTLGPILGGLPDVPATPPVGPFDPGAQCQQVGQVYQCVTLPGIGPGTCSPGPQGCF